MSKHLPAGGEEGNSSFVWLAFRALLHLLNCLYCNQQVFSFSPSDPPLHPAGAEEGSVWVLHKCWLGQPTPIKNWIEPFVYIKAPTQRYTSVSYNIVYCQESYWTFCIETISLFGFETVNSRTPKAQWNLKVVIFPYFTF